MKRGADKFAGVDAKQAAFSDVQVSADQKRVGWLAKYMVCAQSYPCPVELVIYQPDKSPARLAPAYGIFWAWTFVGDGARVAARSGFPHGDETGADVLYDSATGRELARFTPGHGPEPDWAGALPRR